MSAIKALAALAFVAATFGSANANNITWSNNGTAWATPTNWLGGVAPANTDIAVFNSTTFTNPTPSGSIAGIVVGNGSTTTGNLTFLSGVTIGSSGITVTGNGTTGIGQVNMGANTMIGANQTWTNNATNSTNGTAALKLATVASATGAGNVTLTIAGNGTSGSTPLVANNNNYLMDFNQALTDNTGSKLALVIQTTGPGLVSLNSNSNTFTGGLTVKSGIVQLSNANSAGNGTITLGDTSGSASAELKRASNTGTNAINVVAGSNGTLSIGNNGDASNSVAIYSGAVTMANDLTLRTYVGSLTTGNLTMTGGFTGSGNLTLFASTQASGIWVTTNAVNMTGSITNIGNGTSAATISSVIGSNVTGVTQNSTTSALVLTGTNTYNGTTTITAGTLQIGNGITDGSITNSSSVTNNGSLIYNLVGSQTYAYTISGTGNLTKTGAGTLILSGNNTYAGGTTISGGALQLNPATGSLASSSNLTVGGALGGGGKFNADNTGATGNLTTALGKLTTGIGDNVIVTTRTADLDQAVTFTSNSTRASGATLSFVNSGSTNSATNGFVLGGVTVNTFIDKGVFYGTGSTNNYAWYDSLGFVRAINYGVDTGSSTNGTTTTLASKTYQQITGAITAQGNATFTAFNINGNNDVTLAAGTTFSVDSILKNGNPGNATISGGTGIKASNNAELVINTASSADNLTLTTPILGNGTNALTKSGAGTLTLNGANTINGTVMIASGTLTIGSTGTLNGGSYSGAIQNYGALNYLNSANQTLGGAITGTGSLTDGSTGTLTLSGTNSFSGGLTIQSGILQVTTTSSIGTGAVNLGSATGGNATLLWGVSSGSPANAINVVAGTGTRTIEMNQTGSVTFSSSISLNSDLIVDTFTGTASNGLTLSGAITGSNKMTIKNTAAGTAQTTISNSQTTFTGILEIATGATLSAGGGFVTNGTVNVLSGGTFSFQQGASIAGLNGVSGGIASTGQAKTLTLTGSSTYDFAGVIQNGTGGTSMLAMSGLGTQTLSGNNTYTGTTTVSAGTLILSGNNTTNGTVTLNGGTLVAKNVQALGTSAVVINQFTTLDLATDTSINPVNISTGNLLSNSTTIIADRLTSGPGITQTLGTFGISNGILNISKGSNVTGGSPSVTFGSVTLTNTGGVTVTFNPTTASLSMANVNMTTTNNSSQTLVLDGTAAGNTITGVISNVGGGVGTGKIALIKSNTSTWTLSGANTYNGTTTVSGGILTFLNTSAQASGSNVTVAAAGTIGLGVGGGGFYSEANVASLFNTGNLTGLTMNASSGVAIDTSAGNFTQTTALTTTTRALTKLGANTLTLAGTNLYTGTTTVTAGTLLVNGGTSASSAVNVSSGATLGGNGTIAGVVTINNGGMIAPGNGPGVLTVGSLLLNPTSTTAFEINGIATPGTDYDKMVVNTSGGLTLNGTFTIAFGNGSALANTTNINLFNYTGSHAGDFSLLTSSGFYTSAGWTHVGETFSMTYNGQTLTFDETTGNLNVVPEPATWVLLAFSLTTVVVLRRRRQN